MTHVRNPGSASGGVRAALRRRLHHLRTEGAGPGREAAAVGLGVFVGCSPFYGFHLVICWALGALFGLNRLKTYLAAHVSNPLTAPPLVLGQLQVGAWVSRGTTHTLTLQTLATTDPWQFGSDLLVGAAVVGGVFAILAAGLTYALVRHPPRHQAFAALVARASDRYVGESLVAWEFARGKLHHDPVYETVLFGGLLPSGGTLVDIGCGQGLMLALLAEAADAAPESGQGGRRAPRFDRLVGIELRPRVAHLATVALGGRAEIRSADATRVALPHCAAVLIFDVLHMMGGNQQEQLLTAVADALAPGGVVLIREADAAAGWRFVVVRTVNRLQSLRVGSWRQTFRFRDRQAWLAVLARCGFDAAECEQHGGATLGNVLFRATVRRA
jgi:uncharacterized protein (DUF2062 family)